MTTDDISFQAFEILTKLSSGGMGDVLLAKRRGAHGFEKLFAVKTIRGDLAKRGDIRAMFLDEARLVARLDHPAIAHVYDFGEEDSELYLAMEYVPGIALNKLLIKRQAALPPVVACRIAAEVCRGIHAAHELTDLAGNNLGVVHRDLSPGNMILTFDGHMKILDFGIAFMHERESPDTQVGELKGKPSYMAPEQLRAEPVDRRSDLYSLSVVLHEMLTGRKLFTKNNVVATVLAVERGDVPRPSELNPILDPGLDAVVMKGLERVGTDRYQTAKEMAAALDGAIAGMGGEPTLEAFVDAELDVEQRQHKAWMSAVLSGRLEEQGSYEPLAVNPNLTPPALGERSITKNEKDQLAEAALAPSTTLVPAPPTADVPAVAERRSKAPFLLLGLLLAFLIGGGAFFLSAGEPEAIPPLEETTTVEPAEVAEAPPVEEPKADPEPVLEPEPRLEELPEGDPEPEPPKVRSKRRPRTKKRARRTPPPPPPPAGPATYGFVTIGAKPYALVRIDGKEVGVTPIMRRKLPSGRHEIQLVRPDTGEVRMRKVVRLTEGAHERITIP